MARSLTAIELNSVSMLLTIGFLIYNCFRPKLVVFVELNTNAHEKQRVMGCGDAFEKCENR